MADCELLIRQARVLDGTGAEAYTADVAVSAGRIEAVGALDEWTATETVQAANAYLSPGFIDIHTHSDLSVLINPGQVSALAQGVTTQVVGNCGIALGQVLDDTRFQFEHKWLAPYGLRADWGGRFAGFHERISEPGLGTHIVPLAAHGPIRKRAMGLTDRQPDTVEMAEMQRLLEEAIADGCHGFSTGLEYPPGQFSATDELIHLARIAAANGLFYATHLRDEGRGLVEALNEALAIGRAAGIAVQASHHKADGEQAWGLLDTTLEMMRQARDEGMDVSTDVYPYTAYMTSLAAGWMPNWIHADGQDMMVARLNDPSIVDRVYHEVIRDFPELESTGDDSAWSRVVIASARGHREWQGQTVLQLALDLGMHPIRATCRLLALEHGFVSALRFQMREPDVQQVLADPWTMVASDGAGVDPLGPSASDRPHPRFYGTFARILGRYVRERQLLTLEEAVRRMTSLPARRLQFKDRGIIFPGYRADLVLFDPKTILDTSTYDRPHQLAVGVQHVWIDGVTVWTDGQPVARAGRVLLRDY